MCTFKEGSLVLHREYQNSILKVLKVEGEYLLLKHIRKDLTYTYKDLFFKFRLASSEEIQDYLKKNPLASLGE